MPGLTAKYLRTTPARKRETVMDAVDEAPSLSSENSAQEDARGFGRPSWRAAWHFLESR